MVRPFLPECMNDDNRHITRVCSNGHKPFLSVTVSAIKHGKGERIKKNLRRPLECDTMLAGICPRLTWIPLKVVMQFPGDPPCQSITIPRPNSKEGEGNIEIPIMPRKVHQDQIFCLLGRRSSTPSQTLGECRRFDKSRSGVRSPQLICPRHTNSGITSATLHLLVPLTSAGGVPWHRTSVIGSWGFPFAFHIPMYIFVYQSI